jgi:replicative DNA helicase
MKLIGQQRVVDTVIMSTILEPSPAYDPFGGVVPYLNGLTVAMIGIINANDYAKVVRDMWLRRQLIDIGTDLVNSSFGTESASDPLAHARRIINEIEEISAGAESLTGNMVSLEVAVDAALQAMEDAKKFGASGISTGFRCIDARLGGLEDGLVYAIGGRPGSGKEQPIDTPTLTPTGWVPLGTLAPGDMVIGQNGKPTRVVAVHPQGIKQAYRVIFRDLTSTECGANHLWHVASAGGRSRLKFKTRTTLEMLDGGMCWAKKDGRKGAKWRIPLVEPIAFREVTLPIDPYILGVLIGDGTTGGRDLRFSNPDIDWDIRERVRHRLPVGITMRENRSNSCPYYSLRGPGRRTYRALIAAMGLNVKSGKKFIPNEYKFGSISQRTDLLHGLMDTDGSCGDRNRVSFSTTSQMLAVDICDLVRSLGGVAIIRQSDRSADDKGIEYSVNVKMATCPFSNIRKSSRWRNPPPPSKYIHDIVPSRLVEQRCITVAAEDGLYVTNDYIITHNSSLGHQIALHAAGNGVGVLELSLEMSRTQLGRRALSIASGVPLKRMKEGTATIEDGVALHHARGKLAKLPLTIDDAMGQTRLQIAAKIRAAARKKGRVGLVLVDHINLIKAEDGDHGPTHSTGENSHMMLQIAKDNNVVVIELVQLNRGPESREDKRPNLGDLRQSGDIEQDAYAVGFAYRDELYIGGDPIQQEGENFDKFQARQESRGQRKLKSAGKAELIWGKVRDGETGTDHLFFDGKTTSFSEPVADDAPL